MHIFSPEVQSSRFNTCIQSGVSEQGKYKTALIKVFLFSFLFFFWPADWNQTFTKLELSTTSYRTSEKWILYLANVLDTFSKNYRKLHNIQKKDTQLFSNVLYLNALYLIAFIVLLIHSLFIQSCPLLFTLFSCLSFKKKKIHRTKSFCFMCVCFWLHFCLLLGQKLAPATALPSLLFCCVTEIESKACSNIKLSTSGQVIAKVAEILTLNFMSQLTENGIRTFIMYSTGYKKVRLKHSRNSIHAMF